MYIFINYFSQIFVLRIVVVTKPLTPDVFCQHLHFFPPNFVHCIVLIFANSSSFIRNFFSKLFTFVFNLLHTVFFATSLRTASLNFLGGVPTSICHFFCPSVHRAPFLRNCTSSNHNFWYIYVKWWYLQALFFSFFF